jgi:hypothetical protein
MMPDDTEYSRMSQLLPFYVNGTLDASKCTQVDAVLATSPKLRDELAVIGRLAQGVKAGGRELTQDIEGSADRIATRLSQGGVSNTSESKPAVLGGQSRAGLADMLAFLNPKSWHPAVALTLAIAAVAQGLVIGNLSGDKAEGTSQIASLEKRLHDAEFQLASGPDGGANRAASFIVQISPQASWVELEKLLADEGLIIVGGPSDNALMLSSDAKDDALAAQIVRLKASPVFAAVDKAV